MSVEGRVLGAESTQRTLRLELGHITARVKCASAALELVLLTEEVNRSRQRIDAINTRLCAMQDVGGAAIPRSVAETFAVKGKMFEKDGNLNEAATHFAMARDAATAAAAAASTGAAVPAVDPDQGGESSEATADEYMFEIERLRRAITSAETRQRHTAAADYTVLHRDAEGLSLHEFRNKLAYGVNAVVIVGLGEELVPQLGMDWLREVRL